MFAFKEIHQAKNCQILILKLKTSDNDTRALLVCMKYERVCTRVKTIEHFVCQPK